MEYAELDGVMMPVIVRGENSQKAIQLVFAVIADHLGCTVSEIDGVVVSLMRKGT